jgi:hypothetical protein
LPHQASSKGSKSQCPSSTIGAYLFPNSLTHPGPQQWLFYSKCKS